MITKLALENVKAIGIVGTGKIGAAWVAHFLAYGLGWSLQTESRALLNTKGYPYE